MVECLNTSTANSVISCVGTFVLETHLVTQTTKIKKSNTILALARRGQCTAKAIHLSARSIIRININTTYVKRN